jgi:ParB family chromosome partitioning protein
MAKQPEGVSKSDMFYVDSPDMIQIIEGFNHREDFSNLDNLVESIVQRGIDTPLHVRRNRGNKEQPFALIAGERRLKAAKLAHENGASHIRIPVIVKQVDDKQAFEDSVVENIERKNLNHVEESNAVVRMGQFGYSVKEIASKFSRSDQWVRERQVLAEAHSDIKKAVIKRTIATDIAVNLVKAKDQSKQPEELKKILAKAGNAKKKTRKAAASVSGKKIRPGIKDLERVRVAVNGAKGLEEESKEIFLSIIEFALGELPEEDLGHYIDVLCDK